MSKNVGDVVRILIGPYSGLKAEILKVEMNSGARNGWFTVRLLGMGEKNVELLFAGEEIE